MMNIRFMRRNFIFVLFTFILMIFSCSAADAAYTGNVGDVIEDGECLTFTANHIESSESESAPSSVTFAWCNDTAAVQFNKNDSGWVDYSANTIYLNEGEFVRFKGNGVTTDSDNHFSMTGSISASGCVDSLRLKSLETTDPNYRQFQGLDNNCYQYMFSRCTSLTNAPELPATNLAEYCYNFMFNGCTSLTNAPELPATVVCSSAAQI